MTTITNIVEISLYNKIYISISLVYLFKTISHGDPGLAEQVATVCQIPFK